MNYSNEIKLNKTNKNAIKVRLFFNSLLLNMHKLLDRNTSKSHSYSTTVECKNILYLRPLDNVTKKHNYAHI